MFCSKCGKQLPDDAVTCDGCGASLKSTDIIALVDSKSTLLNRWIDLGIEFLKKIPFENFVNRAETIIGRVGVLSFYLLGLIGLIGGITGAIRYDYLGMLWIGIAWLFLCILFAYFGTKLLQSIKALVINTKSLFSSTALLDCIIVLFLLTGIVFLVCGIYFTCDESDFDHLWTGLLGFVVFEFSAICALKPQLVSTEAGVPCSPGEELIGLGTFFLKILLRMLPFIWCLGAFGTMLYVVVHLGAENLNEHIMTGFEATLILGLAPLTYYLGFLIYYFIIDLARAVLSLPGKLDKLNNK